MKQRLGIAQAIMEKPELLILDEPTNSLDNEGVKIFHNIIANFKRRKDNFAFQPYQGRNKHFL